jgi:nucleoside-diphosphate-sugar epimerase
MKVFVAGSTGAIGARLVPQLAAAGHDVVGMTRSTAKAQELRKLGAEAVVADGLDRSAVIDAVARAQPEAVIHQMTAIAGVKSFKRLDREFEQNNRLRTEGTDILLAAAQAAGARRFVAQSFGAWTYELSGGRVKSEDEPFDSAPPAHARKTVDALKHLEAAVLGADEIEGVVLRYGGFYGPGTGITSGGEMVEMVRKRRVPVIGDGAGVWSFTHVDDAAAATVAVLDSADPGIYNVADDEPAPVGEWLPDLAAALGAKPPRHVPVWLARLAAGDVGVTMFTRVRGLSNAKLKAATAWRPAYASWRDGFRRGLDAPLPTATRERAA